MIAQFDARAICNERVLGNLVGSCSEEFRDPLVPNSRAPMREIAVEYVDGWSRRTEFVSADLEAVGLQHSQR